MTQVLPTPTLSINCLFSQKFSYALLGKLVNCTWSSSELEVHSPQFDVHDLAVRMAQEKHYLQQLQSCLGNIPSLTYIMTYS